MIIPVAATFKSINVFQTEKLFSFSTVQPRSQHPALTYTQPTYSSTPAYAPGATRPSSVLSQNNNDSASNALVLGREHEQALDYYYYLKQPFFLGHTCLLL